MSDDAAFIDSNIWLYSLAFDRNENKAIKALQVIRRPRANSFTSYQVIQEVCSNLIKKHSATSNEIADVLSGFERDCQIIPMSLPILRMANDLMQRYSVSYWDSLILATALESKVPLLYSEDMHDGLVIDNRLTIRNPFLAS